MFGNKTKKIHELENKLKDMSFKKGDLDQTLHYLLNGNIYSQSSSVTVYQALMYIQKIICNSIIYGDYAYTVLRNPNTAPNLELGTFLPVSDNHNFVVKDLSKSIYLPSSRTPFLTFPWSNERIIDNIFTIGKDATNRFQTANLNIENVYLYPLGVVLVNNGNHSQLIGILKNEMETVKVNKLYDISKPLEESNDSQFSNFYGFPKVKDMNSIKDKWLALMTVGKYLVSDSNLLAQFPQEILNEI